MSGPSPAITRADDFGASPGTNDAILACLDAGFIRNAGVMVPAPHLSHRLGELVARQDEFCLGLHATLNSEWAHHRWGPCSPVDKVPSLVRPDGTLHESTSTLNESGNLDEMRSEILAQLSLARGLGLSPRYLDTHMNFAWIPAVADMLENLCREEGLVFGNSARFAAAPSPFGGVSESPPDTIPVWIFHPAERDHVSELFYLDPDKPETAVAESRHREFRLLTDRDLCAQTLARHGARPARYSEFADGAPAAFFSGADAISD